MKIRRRQFLQFGAAAIAVAASSPVASAQAYPTRPVRIIVGWPAGGGGDIVARLMGQWLSERLRHAFIVENPPGAPRNIRTDSVADGPPDGYNLPPASARDAIKTNLYVKPQFD